MQITLDLILRVCLGAVSCALGFFFIDRLFAYIKDFFGKKK